MSSYRAPALFVWGLLSLLLTLAAVVCAPTGPTGPTAPTGHGQSADVIPKAVAMAAPAAVTGPTPVPHPHPPVSCSTSDHLAQTSQQTRVPQEPAAGGAAWDQAADAHQDPARSEAGTAARLGRPAPIRTGRTTLLLVCRWRV
ncbi:hypothetical protein [Streptomyces sp. NPDC048172]|uniref:hypothetical protein n=1 Tax=Streptomyces sp. NPDC048172 TaxID=3365505 RepID=UPI0037212578